MTQKKLFGQIDELINLITLEHEFWKERATELRTRIKNLEEKKEEAEQRANELKNAMDGLKAMGKDKVPLGARLKE